MTIITFLTADKYEHHTIRRISCKQQKSAAWSSGESAMVVIDMSWFKTYSCHSFGSLKKTLYSTFPSLEVLASSFSHISTKLKKKIKNYNS